MNNSLLFIEKHYSKPTVSTITFIFLHMSSEHYCFVFLFFFGYMQKSQYLVCWNQHIPNEKQKYSRWNRSTLGGILDSRFHQKLVPFTDSICFYPLFHWKCWNETWFTFHICHNFLKVGGCLNYDGFVINVYVIIS